VSVRGSGGRQTFTARVDEWKDADYNRGFSIELPGEWKDGDRVRVTVERLPKKVERNGLRNKSN